MSRALVKKSDFFKNPITTAWAEYNGYLLGKTTGGVTDTPDMDVADITADQVGTKPDDQVITGMLHQIETSLVDPCAELLSILVPGIEHDLSRSDAATLIGPKLYESLKTTKGATLRLLRNVNESPVEDTDYDNILTYYLAVPVITEALINWTPDSQQALPVSFRIFSKKLSEVGAGSITECTINGETYKRVFGYLGNPSNIGTGLPAATIPDREGPQFTSAEATAADTVNVLFSETVDEIANSTGFVLSVNGSYVVPTGAAINGVDDKQVDLTLPAASVSAGDTVTLDVSAGAVEDADDNGNPEINDKDVTNSVT